MIILDENLPPKAARMLDAFDRKYGVRSIVDFADRGISDLDVFKLLGEMPEKPVFITQDGRILKRPAERAALKDIDITIVFLAPNWMNFSWPEKAWKLVKAWPSVAAEVTNCRKPTVFELQGGSSLKLSRLCLTSEL
ncbi:MAG: hypothetical protein HYV27_01615 [Candidatus Hydrogenedentes bacterium]|nr:hypothetical protein [Candidatus Hydrogenedentota bacterium]